MNIFSIPPFISACLILFLGIFVYLKNKDIAERISFMSICLVTSLWQIAYAISYTCSNKSMAELFLKLGYIGVIFMPATTFHFSMVFIKTGKRWFIFTAYMLSCLFTIFLWFSDLFISGVYKYFWGYYPKASIMHPLFMIDVAFFVSISVVYFYINSYHKKKRLDISVSKIHQNKYMLWAYLILVSCSFDFIPNYGVAFYPISFIFILAFVSIVAYAIVRHHLMDIEVIVKKTLVFAGLSAFVLCCITVSTFLMQDVLGRTVGIPKALSYVFTAIILIVLYDPVKKLLVNITDRFLFQKKYSYREFMTYIDYVVTVMDRDKIFKGTEELLGKTLHPSSFDILLPYNDKNRYISYIANETKTNVIESNSLIIEYLKSTRSILSIENENDKKISKEVKTEMSDLKVALAIPLLLRDEFIGVMLLGKKKSDEYYTQEDLIILMNLARTLSIALKNAEFIKERDAMHMEMTRAKLKEELATMAYGVSHQFNNKFQGIAWTIKSAEMVLSKANIPSDIKSNIQSVFDDMAQAQKDALGAGEIVQGILNFTKPDRLQFNMVDITSNLDIVLQLVEYKHPTFKEVEVIKNIEKNLPLTYAHLGYLQEAYFIMVDNACEAIEYMKARNRSGFKGQITISASTDKKSNGILVSVKDNGVGMAPDVLEKVRNAIPFFTTKGSSGKSGHGAGINMLSKFIDDFHKGKVIYDSIPDGGTTVTIYLPITDRPKEIDKKEKE